MGIRIRSVEGRNPLCDKLQYVHTWTFVGCWICTDGWIYVISLDCYFSYLKIVGRGNWFLRFLSLLSLFNEEISLWDLHAVCLYLLSTFEPVDHFLWNLMWTLCCWKSLHSCSFLYFPTTVNDNVADTMWTCEVWVTVLALNIGSWNCVGIDNWQILFFNFIIYLRCHNVKKISVVGMQIFALPFIFTAVILKLWI